VAEVDLWFDPICPWAWVTSRWLHEAERVRDLRVGLHVMSLSVLNADSTDVSDAYRERLRQGWHPVRVMMATDLGHGQDGVRALYTAMGTLIHVERVKVGRDLFARALDRARLPHTLANAALTTAYDDAVVASHRAGVADLGDAAATPVIQLAGADGRTVAFVGPVLGSIPRGEAAGELWDAVALSARVDALAEFRRARPRRPDLT
jgi:hypothetical protein